MRRRLWRSFSSQWTKMAMAPSPKRLFSYLSKIVLIFTPKASRAVLVQKYSLTWRKNCCQSSPTNCQCFTKSSTSWFCQEFRKICKNLTQDQVMIIRLFSYWYSNNYWVYTCIVQLPTWCKIWKKVSEAFARFDSSGDDKYDDNQMIYLFTIIDLKQMILLVQIRKQERTWLKEMVWSRR